MAAKWTDFVAGAVLEASQINSVLDNFSDVAVFQEQQASGTNGGTFTSGSWVKRVLNTTVINNITGCSIASSVITLPAGTYRVLAKAPCHRVSENKTRIQNTTAGTTIILGTSELTANTDNIVVSSMCIGTFTLSVSSTIEFQHRAGVTQATSGLGVGTAFGDAEVFAVIQIERIA